jgi:hypothetical protein
MAVEGLTVNLFSFYKFASQFLITSGFFHHFQSFILLSGITRAMSLIKT